jgi:hypothetical protein
MKNSYSQKDFEKDINQLEKLVRNQSLKKSLSKSMKSKSMRNNNNNENNENNKENKSTDEKNENNNNNNENKSKKEKKEKKDNNENNENNEQDGGKKEYTGEMRHFKLWEVDGKLVDYESTSSIKEHHSPLTVAKRLLKTIAARHKLTGNDKVKLKPTMYTIKETTQGSKKKVFGPYMGKYVKYAPNEIKKVKLPGGKTIVYKLKTVVKLHKKKNHNKMMEQKGGEKKL